MKRGPIQGDVGLGIAGAFKFHALAWAPGLVMFGGLPALAGLVLASFATWAPALLLVGPGPILASLLWAERLHDWAGWSLAGFIESIGGGKVPSWPFAITRWAGGALAAGAVVVHAWRRRPAPTSWGTFLAGGLAIFLVVLYSGYWSTPGYLAQIAPILCWEIDDLVGARPVRRSVASAQPKRLADPGPSREGWPASPRAGRGQPTARIARRWYPQPDSNR